MSDLDAFTEEDPNAEPVDEAAIEEQRRIAALNFASHVQHNGIDDYLDAAVKTEKYLKTGKVKNEDESNPV